MINGLSKSTERVRSKLNTIGSIKESTCGRVDWEWRVCDICSRSGRRWPESNCPGLFPRQDASFAPVG